MTPREHDIVIAGSNHKVSILQATNDHYLLVEYDGIPFEIFLSDETRWPRLGIVDGLPLEVEKSSSASPNHILLVNAKEIQVSFAQTIAPEDLRAEHSPTESPRPVPSSHKDIGRVVAHMPGRIVAVKVKPSDRVKVGDPMFVILAMKMENTLVAPIDGIIIEVYVRSGGSVNKGDLLALIGD